MAMDISTANIGIAIGALAGGFICGPLGMHVIGYGIVALALIVLAVTGIVGVMGQPDGLRARKASTYPARDECPERRYAAPRMLIPQYGLPQDIAGDRFAVLLHEKLDVVVRAARFANGPEQDMMTPTFHRWPLPREAPDHGGGERAQRGENLCASPSSPQYWLWPLVGSADPSRNDRSSLLCGVDRTWIGPLANFRV